MLPNEFVSIMSEPASQVFAVDFQHHVRPRDHQIFVAAFQLRLRRNPSAVRFDLLQHGAHRAIQDQDAFTEKFAKGQALLDQVFMCS